MRTVEREHMLPAQVSELWLRGFTASQISEKIYRETGQRFRPRSIYEKMRRLRRAGANIGRRR